MTAKAFFLVLFAISSALVICDAGGLWHKTPRKHKHHGLKDDFYHEACPRAEGIVQEITQRHVSLNRNLPAKLLRLHFHDCFVRGCDASVLLNSTDTSKAEKEAIPNLSLEGFGVIDDIKTELEKECEGIVSCADILALAARDAVSVQYGRPLWKVLTGRRDGVISFASEALLNLPSPYYKFTLLKNIFALKGLSVHDLVTLSGAHTLGVGHCNFFSHRLYNFTKRGDQDPSLDPTYATYLKSVCKNQWDTTTTVSMDPRSTHYFDNHYFVALRDHKCMFTSDATLLTNDRASEFARELLQPEKFLDEFAISIQKMGAISVLTGKQGQIRRKCSVVN